jgi:hypothetical protein
MVSVTSALGFSVSCAPDEDSDGIGAAVGRSKVANDLRSTCGFILDEGGGTLKLLSKVVIA